jgi:pyruvate formate lyase activating enzyme
MGEFKWQELRLSYKLADTQPPSPEALEEVKRAFSSRGLTVV